MCHFLAHSLCSLRSVCIYSQLAFILTTWIISYKQEALSHCCSAPLLGHLSNPHRSGTDTLWNSDGCFRLLREFTFIPTHVRTFLLIFCACLVSMKVPEFGQNILEIHVDNGPKIVLICRDTNLQETCPQVLTGSVVFCSGALWWEHPSPSTCWRSLVWCFRWGSVAPSLSY